MGLIEIKDYKEALGRHTDLLTSDPLSNLEKDLVYNSPEKIFSIWIYKQIKKGIPLGDIIRKEVPLRKATHFVNLGKEKRRGNSSFYKFELFTKIPKDYSFLLFK